MTSLTKASPAGPAAPLPGAPAATPAARRALLPRQPLARHLLLGLLVLAALFALTTVLGAYRDFQVATIGFYAVAIAGLTVLTGANGQVSLGHGALMGVGAYTAAKLINGPGLPLVQVLVICVVVTAVVGAVVGAAASRLRGPSLAGATLALAVGLPGLPGHFSAYLGGEPGLSVPSPPLPGGLGAGFPLERWQAWIAIAVVVVTFILLANLLRSRVGRSWRAVRDDEVAASLAGLHVARWQVTAFTVSAACAGLGGGLLAITIGLVAPANFLLTLSLSLLTGMVLGGLGSLTGAVIGAVAVVLLPTLAHDLAQGFALSTSVESNLPLALYGLLLILLMLFAPDGLAGLGRRVAARVRGAGAGPGTAGPEPAREVAADALESRRTTS